MRLGEGRRSVAVAGQVDGLPRHPRTVDAQALPHATLGG